MATNDATASGATAATDAPTETRHSAANDSTGTDTGGLALRAVVRTPGGPDALQLERIPVPMPGPGQVVVAMQAAGVGFGDVQLRQGSLPGRFPVVPGYDVVGTVSTLGAGVTGLAVGQRVAAFAGTGGYATHVPVRADLCVPVPEDLDAAQLAALVLNYTTAWQLLHRAARVRPGSRLLVLNAAGGLGSAITELATLAGLTVYGTAAPGRHATLKARGVAVVEDLDDLTPPVDVTLDAVGGPSLARSRRATAKDGVVVSYGASYATVKNLSKTRLMTGSIAALARARLTPGPRLVLFLITTSIKKDPAGFRHDLAHLVELLRAGTIRPQVETLPLTHAAQGHQRLADGRVMGKLVLTHPA